MSGAAIWAIVVTRCRPQILPFFAAPVALVIVAEEVLLLHGKLSFLNADLRHLQIGLILAVSGRRHRGAVIGTADCGALTPRLL